MRTLIMKREDQEKFKLLAERFCVHGWEIRVR